MEHLLDGGAEVGEDAEDKGGEEGRVKPKVTRRDYRGWLWPGSRRNTNLLLLSRPCYRHTGAWLWGYKPLYPHGPIWAAPSEVARPTG